MVCLFAPEAAYFIIVFADLVKNHFGVFSGKPSA
jgi:hypothetical protein